MEKVRLLPHPTARDKAVANVELGAGSLILSVPALSTILLNSEKGRRCDMCHCLWSQQRRLLRCTGCASYWYCDTQCQNLQWQSHHKRICKNYTRFVQSPQYQALADYKKMDSLLLSHLVAQTPDGAKSPLLSMFLSLTQGSTEDVPPVCSNIYDSSDSDWLRSLYSRFSNNNFAIHSHLTTFGHGIFPLASRLFNHSCIPNAAVKYIVSPAQTVVMEVVALRDISIDEEICVPYLDPALLQARFQIFEFSYGFKCDCLSCQCLERLGRIPEPPTDSNALATLRRRIREFVGIRDFIENNTPPNKLESIPESLLPALHESFMQNVSEDFSKASHEGLYHAAQEAGITLLALYVLIYPPNYPQIGMHLLEMAKTNWNFFISSQEASSSVKDNVRILLTLARNVLSIYGEEGDDRGPFDEIDALDNLLEG